MSPKFFIAFFCRSSACLWFGGPCPILLSLTQNNFWLVGCREQLEKKRYRVRLKSIVFLQNCKMKSKKYYCCFKVKKMFLFEKSEKNVQFNSLFLGIPKIFICVRVKQMAFLSEDWKKLSVWTEGWKKVVRLNRGLKKVVRLNRGLKKVVCLKQCPLYGFRFRNA